jgi:hypothetical protein
MTNDFLGVYLTIPNMIFIFLRANLQYANKKTKKWIMVKQLTYFILSIEYNNNNLYFYTLFLGLTLFKVGQG